MLDFTILTKFLGFLYYKRSNKLVRIGGLCAMHNISHQSVYLECKVSFSHVIVSCDVNLVKHKDPISYFRHNFSI